MKTKNYDPRDDPQQWMNADPMLTRVEAEWYARMWRHINARIENRDSEQRDSGLTRLERYRPREN